jgi:Protein of unknown function (DUF3455)
MGDKRQLRHVLASLAGVLVLCGALTAAASAQVTPQTMPGDPLDPRSYAPESTSVLALHAVGVQKYTCQANGTWLFTDPEATLYGPSGAPVGTHFLNFATGRPVWQLQDGSSVEAARKADAAGGSGNIAWLLLQAVATTGRDGGGLGATTWVQRLNTSGGVAPAGACTPGARAAVPYSADYYFWSAGGDSGHGRSRGRGR